MKTKLIKYLLFLMATPLYSQTWPKMCLPNTIPNSVLSWYDKGYVIGGGVATPNGLPKLGLLIKTDINGQILWYKHVGQSNYRLNIKDITLTVSDGLVISGYTTLTDSWGDPFVMKLNACMETEWCRIYSVGQGRFDCASSIKQVSGGYIVYVHFGGDLYSNEHIHLYRLDTNGDMVWQQSYGNSDSLMLGADAEDMMITHDHNYLLTGYCYYPDSGTTGPRYLRPLLIKVDSSGEVEWELPWRYVSGAHFYGMSERTIVDNNGMLYSCGRHIEDETTPPGDRPTMLKTDADGNELLYRDLVPNSWQANFFNINWLQDSTIMIDGGWIMSYGGQGQIGVFKTDRNGNILDSVTVMQTNYCFSDAIVDQDNKLFLVQGIHNGAMWNSYSWKLNSDLEFDTLYTQPFVYDSLCPYPIPSDTIPFDCVIVGVDEPLHNPATGKLKVFPNPASEILHIELPVQLKSQTATPVFNLTTVYHQWRSAQVEIYDLFGRRMYASEVRQSEKRLDVDVSAWPRGLYVVRLVYLNKTVATAVVVVG